ncbi:GntR family transcriptional regulator [Desulfonema magnum]|uniref:GntR family transcriptional regulator n=1 Tax=Desulfonema magnum TaxID=45655 RepID=A0A975GQ81_9BACT|nr:GntR family transcriptional regulator [Desulfonema magnum]QTA89607.1 Putative GntR family transcriptional regulator [Desulfonema magnum]
MKQRSDKKARAGLEDMSHKAYHAIRKMLYHKELVPGQKIVYRELTERLDMSPTPVIQALSWLEFQGLAFRKPNCGYYITPCSLEELEELFEIRELLEPSLIPAVIENLDEEGLEELKSALEAHRSAAKNVYSKERLFRNREFHLTLASLSKKHNRIRILQNIFDVLFLKYGGSYLSFSSLNAFNREHQKIYDCVAAKKIKEARKLLSKHTANVKEQIVSSYKQMIEEKHNLEF